MAKGRSPLACLAPSGQSAADRRQLRVSYRQLHAQAVAGKENIINGGSDLAKLLEKADALHSKAEKPREHAVDAEVFAQLAQCGLAMIKNGQASHQGRMPGDLIRALRATFLHDPSAAHQPRLQPHDFDWAAVGAAVSGLHRTVPGVSCLLGPLEAQAKAPRVVVRRARQAVDELTRPQEVETIQDGDKQETDRNYENMWRQLRSVVGIGQRVPLIQLVCNHGSFAQTVENIFTLSFLVRDQRVRLVCDPQEGVMAVPVSEEQRTAAAQQGQAQALQFMMSFFMQDWEDMKLLVPADSCIMPHRGAAPAPARGRSRPASGGAADQQQQQAKRMRRS